MANEIRDAFNSVYADGPSGNPQQPPKSRIRAEVGGAIQATIDSLSTRVTDVEAIPAQIDDLSDQMVAADTAAAGRLTVLEGQVMLSRHPLATARFATTANVNLASTTAFQNGATYDGLTLATNDRFVVSLQTTGSQNGAYVVQATGAPVRATDADAGSELLGATIKVLQGTYAGTTFAVTNTSAPTVGTDAINIVATDKQSTANDDDLRRIFPSSMASGRQFFSGASGDPSTRPSPPPAFSFDPPTRICTVTLAADEEYNLSFAGLLPATPGKSVDIGLDYQIVSGSMANIGPQIWKIGAAPTYTQAGRTDASLADSTTGVRKSITVSFSDVGSASPGSTVYPNSVAWPSGSADMRPGYRLKAGASGAVLYLFEGRVDLTTSAHAVQQSAVLAKRAAMPAYGQMDRDLLGLFTNLASGNPDTIPGASNTTEFDSEMGVCAVMQGPGDVQIGSKGVVDATPGRVYPVEADFKITSGIAEMRVRAYRLSSTFTQTGLADILLGTFSAASGRQTLIVKFDDAGSGGNTDWSSGGNAAAKLRFELYAVHDGATPARVLAKSLRQMDAVAGGGGGSSEDADRAEAAADRAEAAQDALEGLLFVQHNPLFDNAGIGWWVDAYTASPAGGQLAATQNGVTFPTDSAAKGGQKAAIILDDALVLWRKLRSVDTTLGYAVTCAVKANSGTLTFSAGLACYDYAGVFLGYRWCAANGQTVGTSYTDFTGAISGEGVADSQFPSGTKRVREAWRISGSTDADLAQLLFTYSGA